MIDKASFFTKIKANGLFKTLNQNQVDSFNALFDECEKQGVTDIRQIAYIFATVYHEVNKTMMPIEEYGKGKNRTYGHKVKYSGKPYVEPDKIYYGRGHTQNTWYEIYEKLTKVNPNGWDFLNKPELLLQLQPSIWATVYAMRTGLYTGKKLSWYIGGSECDFMNARRIINGTDKAEMIMGYANKFLAALQATP